MSLIFRFTISNNYWSLNATEIIDQARTLAVLNVVGEEPSAPVGFSYKCSRALVFKNNGNLTLTLRNVQVNILLILI